MKLLDFPQFYPQDYQSVTLIIYNSQKKIKKEIPRSIYKSTSLSSFASPLAQDPSKLIRPIPYAIQKHQ